MRRPLALLVGLATLCAGSVASAEDGIIFTSALHLDASGNQRGGIYMFRADGSDKRKLTNFSTLNFVFQLHSLDLPDDHPSCSPDGKTIVFMSARDSVALHNDFHIYTMDVHGQNVRQLTSFAGITTNPTFSPDGKKIAFSAELGTPGVLHIFSMNADGTGVTQLTSGPLEDTEPTWSPDGTKIAFTRIQQAGVGLAFTQKDVYLINSDGSGLRALTDKLGEDHDPTFSPDGKKLAISTERTLIPNPPFGDTFIIDVAKGTADDGINLTSDLAFGAGDPSWSPDGTRIAFFKSVFPMLQSPMQIWTMRTDGSDKQHITHSLPDGLLNVHPGWCKLADTDGDGRPDYAENQNASYPQIVYRPPGLISPGAHLGAAVAFADLDHDGVRDIIAASPDETVSATVGAGSMVFILGSKAGPDFEGGDSPRVFHAASLGGALATNGRFGRSLAGCDFDGDGFTDLAIGAPGQNRVFVMRGLDGPYQALTGTGEFGFALAAGDFNGDGKCDLAVGAPSEVRGGVGAGAVRVFLGTANGLSTSPQIIDQAVIPTPTDVGGTEAGDRFGASLGAGKLDGNSAFELAIGVPSEDVAGVSGAGVVHVVPGVVGGPLAVASAVTRDARSLPSPFTGLQANGAFGDAVAIGKFTASLGSTDLIVGVPRHDVGGVVDAGVVATYGTSSLTSSLTLPATGKAFGTATLGRTAETGARLGHALVVGDMTGDAIGDLAVSAPGLSADGIGAAGIVFVVPGSGANATTPTSCALCQSPIPTTIGGTGLSPASAVRIQQSNVGETVELGDRFGGSSSDPTGTLAAADFDGDGQADLLIGTPNEDFVKSGSGMFSVRYGLRVGISTLTPTYASVKGGDTTSFTLGWKHPERWRALETLHLRLADDDGVALWVRFDEAANTFAVYDDTSASFVTAPVGADGSLDVAGGALVLDRSSVTGSGPDGPTVDVTFALRVAEGMQGRTFRVEVFATDDRGHTQGFDPLGTLEVAHASVAREVEGGCASISPRAASGWWWLFGPAALFAWRARRRRG